MSLLFSVPISVERKVRTSDGIGGFNVAWQKIAETWGSLSALSARTQTEYGQLQIEVSHKVFLPPDTDVAKGDRLSAGGKKLEVREILDPGGRGHHLEVLAKEIQ